jgi:shikimate dehydrogenase
MTRIDSATRLCAVIGNPVEHSLSPAMHNAAFRATGLNYVYVAFRVEDVAACLTGMRALPSFRGMSVTIPHKRAVMAFLDEIEPFAEHVGSVNTVTNEDGRLIGSITDGPGTLRAFEEAGIDLKGRRVLFLGAGGAVRAVAFAVADAFPGTQMTILGRTASHVEELVNDVREKGRGEVVGGSLESDLKGAMASHDVVVQGTPVGMHPHTADSAIPKEWLRADQVIFDMVYRPHRTRLVREAEAVGCRVVFGVEMLINQAVLQFERWTGVPAPVSAMREALLEALAREDA